MRLYTRLAELEGEEIACKKRTTFKTRLHAIKIAQKMTRTKSKYGLWYTVIKCPFCDLFHIVKGLDATDLQARVVELERNKLQTEFSFVSQIPTGHKNRKQRSC